jgi:hypothetical protein
MYQTVECAPQVRTPLELPEPEDVFLCWIVAQPEGKDLLAAAQAEIVKLQTYRGNHTGPRRLLDLFAQLCRQLRATPEQAMQQ